MPRSLYTLAGAAALCLLAGPAAAMTVYKWTDDQGVVHYSDAPPPGRDAQRLELEGSRPRPSAEQSAEPEEAKEEKGPPEALDVNITQAELQVDKLEQQVEQARKLYEQARENRIEGEKIRKGSEQNYVRYLERIERLKSEEERTQENLEKLQEKLEQARARLEELREKKASQ
ncbi:MAG TPA: DUF4124 domain-containing protein [Gammaproteobacteria bacterium]|nr:DUF4124 domain-containing protein [Gammaproteobacteria bacterium]